MRRLAALLLFVASPALAGDAPPPAPPVAAPPAPPAAPGPVAPARAVAPREGIDAERIRTLVNLLASKPYGGRGTADDREKTAAALAELLARVVKPAPGATSLLRPFAAKDGSPAGTNVVGWIPGARTDEHIVISAHYDHLLPKKDVWFPGADDNASGVAALLEVAGALARGTTPPARSILIVAFDLEETNCVGSTRYCEEPALPLEQCAAFTTMDMMGRSMADGYPGLLLVMGAERADALAGVTSTMPAAAGVVVRELGMDFNQLGWSDYVPFEARRIPSLFFTSGACRDYHRETDTADKLDLEALAGRAATVLAAVRALAALPERPVWKEKATPRMLEIESLHALVKGAAAKEEEWNVPPAMRGMRKTFEENLAKTIAKGSLTVGERVAIRNLALMMFQAATKAR